MADYKVILTNNGLDKLEDSMANGTQLVVKEMGFGDAFGEPYIPVVTQEDLKHKILTKPLDEALVTEGTIRYKTSLLSTDPSGDFIELGLYLDDGTLFAVANIPKLEHRQSTSGAVTETEVTLVMVAENAENITISLSSNIYVSKDYANTYYLRTDGNNNVTSDISMAGHKITELKDGVKITDAASVNQVNPIGSLILWAGIDPPEKYIETDGESYSRLGDKADLYLVIGTYYGAGSGTMTFNVPKLDPPDPTQPNIRYIIRYKN